MAGKNEQNGVISRVAVASGNIESSYAAGGVTGDNRGTIEDAYNKATITSGEYAAGITALNHNAVKNVYNVGSISSTSSNLTDEHVASIVVLNLDNSTINNAYAVMPSQIYSKVGSNSNVYNSASVLPEKLGDIATFNDWDFANTWVIKTAQYPTFRNQSADADISNLNIPDGSQARPFEITSAAGLKSIGNDEESLTKHYVLKNNISMKYNSDYIQMDPIGSEDTPFTGSLDGNGFTISDLKITSQKSVNGQDYSALFAVNNGTIKNLRFAVATIGENGVENASVVAGINNGTIEQVAIETGGKITAKNAAGFAIENNGTIENSYITSTALVSNNASAGIVISNNAGATIGYGIR